MPSPLAPSPSSTPQPTIPAKRPCQASVERTSPASLAIGQSPPADTAADASFTAGHTAMVGQSSNFRNVSACNRCRLRKNRCDQSLPSCLSCVKAGVACIGYDPITKKEIPRSYVYYLEARVEQLEALLRDHQVDFPSASELDHCSKTGVASTTLWSVTSNQPDGSQPPAPHKTPSQLDDVSGKRQPCAGPDGSGSRERTSSRPRSLASTAGVSFARVLLAAVQHSSSDQASNPDKPASRHPPADGTSMRDSFFGLHTKPTIRPAPFPDEKLAMKLVDLYFQHANPQIPILHRVEFMQIFDQAYAQPESIRTARESYMLNMVFAIGSGVIIGEPVESDGRKVTKTDAGKEYGKPEEYHASAIVHLEACLSMSGGGIEVLQLVLLLANFALLRPVPPGLWYIVGVAIRLAVDLGLHYEDGSDVDLLGGDPTAGAGIETESGRIPTEKWLKDRGRRLYTRDLRRRLWWCTYALDRLVSTCVGRPFGISDQVITTEFPSPLDDDYITPDGFLDPPDNAEPSYKSVAYHYFRLRLLQSEIVQVLQYNQAQQARAKGQNLVNRDMHTALPSPFLVKFVSFRAWRIDIDRRLYEWRSSAPTKQDTGVAFSTEFLELNYWQAIVVLYRQSLSIPAVFEGEYNTAKEVNSPSSYQEELSEDEEKIYLKVAEAGQTIVRIYRQLHMSGLVSYTYLTTHHLFMAGISYLYAIWHSPIVRSQLSMDEVDFTVLAAKSVFTDLMDKCPPAETCCDAFDRTAKATIKMANSTGGFGMPPAKRLRLSAQIREEHMDWPPLGDDSSTNTWTSPRRHLQIDPGLSNALSSPIISLAGGGPQSPTLPVKTLETEGLSHAGPSPPDINMTSQDNSLVDASLLLTPIRSHGTLAAISSSSLSDQSSFFPGLMDLTDLQDADVLPGLAGTPREGGEPDQSFLDLGFGINWDGLSHDFSDGQQVNIFDAFFFGSQPGAGS